MLERSAPGSASAEIVAANAVVSSGIVSPTGLRSSVMRCWMVPERMRNVLLLTEGFAIHGGLSGRDRPHPRQGPRRPRAACELRRSRAGPGSGRGRSVETPTTNWRRRSLTLSLGAALSAVFTLLSRAALPNGGHDILTGLAALAGMWIGGLSCAFCLLLLCIHVVRWLLAGRPKRPF
jgi:hypothetical protein